MVPGLAGRAGIRAEVGGLAAGVWRWGSELGLAERAENRAGVRVENRVA